MKNKKPAFRRILPLFLAMVLCITMQDMTAFAAETAETALKSETIEITGAERYDEEYYAKPALRFPVKQKRLYSQEREEQSLEEYVVAALENYETVIDVSAYNISRSEGSQEYLRILNNNPQLFYVQAQAVLSCMGNQVIYYRPYYLAGKEEAMQMKEELEMAVQQALEQVDESMDAVQKALVVHDYLVQNCEYDQERLMTGSVPDISHTSYGALVNGMAVCDGYAHAYAYIMEHKLGIPCTVVSSDSMNHAWNMIEIDGKWYHVDLTWDDPVWDCIGRVNHNYFLLSDEAISQNHYVWTNDYTANSDRYDREFWIGVESAISYYNGAWYYSGYEPGNRKVVLKKKKGLFAANAETVYQTSLWQASGQSFYPSSFMYLAQANRKLYFNTSTEIMQMNAGGDVQVFYEPDDLAGKQIFGFTVQGGEFLYAPNDDAYTSGKQSDIRKYSRGKIEGITAENVTGVYNGNPYKIEILGLKEGDLVYYALAGGADIKYSETQPDMTNAGTYRVRYRVDREGYAAHGGIVTVTITKAEVKYTIPQECTGKSGGTLADIELPEGFAWKNPQTQLCEEGKNAFPAVYTPEDSVNYQTVNVDIIVSVTCPGHNYTDQVTKWPTAQEEGIRTYTCVYCTDSYTETIPKTEITEPGPTEPSATPGQKPTEPSATPGQDPAQKEGVANLNYTFEGMDGTSVSTGSNSGQATVIIFGRTTCGNTQSTLRSIAASQWVSRSDIRVIFAECDNASSQAVQSFAAVYGYNDITFCYDEGDNINLAMWEYYDRFYASNSVTLPITVVIDGENQIRHCLTGYQTADTIMGKMEEFVVAEPSTTPSQEPAQPSVTPGKEPVQREIPAKSRIIRDTSGNTYQVTQSGEVNGTVVYVKAENNEAATVNVPSKVTIDDITYEVTSISAGAFRGNTKLKKVTIGKNVTSIGNSAFEGCTALKSIVIPTKVRSIGKNAFKNCKKLKSIQIKGNVLKTVGKNAFRGIHVKAKIKVPKKQLEAYKKRLKGKGQKKTVNITR